MRAQIPQLAMDLARERTGPVTSSLGTEGGFELEQCLFRGVGWVGSLGQSQSVISLI